MLMLIQLVTLHPMQCKAHMSYYAFNVYISYHAPVSELMKNLSMPYHNQGILDTCLLSRCMHVHEFLSVLPGMENVDLHLLCHSFWPLPFDIYNL